jgi:hypothetical protein
MGSRNYLIGIILQGTQTHDTARGPIGLKYSSLHCFSHIYNS